MYVKITIYVVDIVYSSSLTNFKYRKLRYLKWALRLILRCQPNSCLIEMTCFTNRGYHRHSIDIDTSMSIESESMTSCYSLVINNHHDKCTTCVQRVVMWNSVNIDSLLAGCDQSHFKFEVGEKVLLLYSIQEVVWGDETVCVTAPHQSYFTQYKKWRWRRVV